MAVFSTISHQPPVSAHPLPPPLSPRQPRLAMGRVWLLTEVSLWAPGSQRQIILRQIPKERQQIDKVRENLAEDSGILADDPPPADAAAAQAIHELEQVLGPQPSTSTSLEKSPKKPSRKNPFVKLIRL